MHRFHAGNSVKDKVGCVLVGELGKDKKAAEEQQGDVERLIKVIESVGYCTLGIWCSTCCLELF